FTAIVANTLLVFHNLLTVFAILQILTGIEVNLNAYVGLAGAWAIGLVNYFVLARGKRTKAIYALFRAESESQKKKRTMWCWIYVAATFLMFFGTAWIRNFTAEL